MSEVTHDSLGTNGSAQILDARSGMVDATGVPYHPKGIQAAVGLADSSAVFRDLSAIDWAFEDADTQFWTHDVHPYPAKFIPQIPGHLIARLSLPGDLVLDPFGGSGTTALEAVRLGRRATSIDANPLAALIGQVKTASVSPNVRQELDAVRAAVTAHLASPLTAEDALARYATHIPDIVHREKWFADQSVAELACIRNVVDSCSNDTARCICQLALSRTVQAACFQDSETRYASRPRAVLPGESLQGFVRNLDRVLNSVGGSGGRLAYGLADFLTGDASEVLSNLEAESVDLVVTSPPYGNAYDYHLYLRFRLLWLGFDPRELGRMEIGSHLRHQRQGTGFEEYMRELGDVVKESVRVLRSGRYIALVAGDPVYGGHTYAIADEIGARARDLQLDYVGAIRRPLHAVKRSVSGVARRAQHEDIVLLRKPEVRRVLALVAPPYRLWPYEEDLREREAAAAVDAARTPEGDLVVADADDSLSHLARRLAFTHGLSLEGSGRLEPTWQAILENGSTTTRGASRKDPKYVTHGLHDYKGKFYPQLAKALINLMGHGVDARVLDPFCGSGTALLEARLGGQYGYGLDLNPIAARIAQGKVGVLDYDPDVVENAAAALLGRLDGRRPTSEDLGVFPDCTHDEMLSWFPEPVAWKLGLVLREVRSLSSGPLQAFFESILSSLVRDVSQQEPLDLRIRRRKQPLDDADVFGLFSTRLDLQLNRLRKYWAVSAYCPHQTHPAKTMCGDSREWRDLAALGIEEGGIDFILTSPPYAVALPYIDTDRLSLLLLDGLTASARRPIEQGLTGSREIVTAARKSIELDLRTPERGSGLPPRVSGFLQGLLEDVSGAEVGFRRRNMPALLARYCVDMQRVLRNCRRALKEDGQAAIVIGDSRMTIADTDVRIPTTELVGCIAEAEGLAQRESIPIDVTRDSSLHRRNSITKNAVLVFGPG